MQNAPKLTNWIEKLTAARLLVIGDVMFDRFVYGDAARLSPEAPVPVLAATRVVSAPGGVGNVAANLSALGVDVTLLAVAGDDAAGAELAAILERRGVRADLVVDPSRPTIRKERYIANGQHLLRVDAESAAPLAAEVESALCARIPTLARGCAAIVVSDYGKGVVGPKILDAVRATGLPFFVDPKGRDYARYHGAAAITPNKKELADATGMGVSDDSGIVAAARRIRAECGIATVLATRAAEGMTLVGADEPLHLRARAREVFDVSGAGDTVIAVFAAAMAVGADAGDAAALANAAAGRVVEKSGTATLSAKELRAALADAAPSFAIAPVLSWDDAAALAARWREGGLKVGFTNGCFDILHQGHVTMLAHARAVCDRLILGLNCDASVTRLKGVGRPVNDQDARARVVAALGSIDAVVLFGANADEGDTPLKLIQTVRPDMLFKGADYTRDRVIGADFVESTGGRVALLPLEDGFSTTATIRKIGAA
ncbi:MAG: bifunctional heptose 7-phosphate kinase/heptose 1-phosphate adenyltransferase [Rhodospirillales bacterium]|nr:bifunctional heptose 7-phosphate kinase/heptose 1-phosphate adenyltransferase [Alphaproteobacteria bacterium]MCB9986454.1 bifunctional heptose 7-phosphate kinase/heptose 1-phosphate adenyltransferase [Rhodospirillales bacterium]USO07000.1 MAG: bifunctional heptose 7-phosphate kinase/heptose 1-phosphate adenyltransferase [Rhodospirillales bacterium]